MERIPRALMAALLLGIASLPAPGYGDSPYTSNGLGYETAVDNGPARGMGGVGIADINGYTLLGGNPALLAGVTRSTLVFGASNNFVSTSVDAGSEQSARTDADILSFAFPVGRRIVIGWGLRPFSRANASIALDHVQDGQHLRDTVDVTGGITTSATSIAGSISDRIRFGYSMNYHFGTIQEEWHRTFPDNSQLLPTAFFLKRKYSGYSHSFGTVASFGKLLSVGVGYTTGSSLEQKDDVVLTDMSNPDIHAGRRSANLPRILQFGVFSNLNDRMGVGLDAAFENWKDAAVTAQEREQYTNTVRIGAGFRYRPNAEDTAPYYQKIPLTAGLRYRTLYYKSHPVVDVVRETVLTAGAEFPLKSNLGILAASVEAGIRGDKQANGFRESIFGFNIALIGNMH